MSYLDFSMNFEEMLEIMNSLPSPKGTYNEGFKDCPARFDGQLDAAHLEAFLYTITVHKFENNLTDQEAIEDLETLLEGAAKICWQNLQVKPTTWTETICWIRKTLGVKLPSFSYSFSCFKPIFARSGHS